MSMTPKELMISRYEAFVREDWQYLVDTSLNQTIQELENSVSLEWLKLEIIDSYDNFVEFKAYYRADKMIQLLHEKSSFIKIDNKWKYDQGILFNSKVSRNEKCPCGSGKKYKQCCSKC